MAEYVPGPGEDVAVETRQEVKRPRMFKVLLHNDHYTTMEFVVEVLEDVFGKGRADAVRIMLNVHRQGVGVAGTFTAEIAETKINRVHALAREAGFPLMCSMEPE